MYATLARMYRLATMTSDRYEYILMARIGFWNDQLAAKTPQS
jgi:hypothetical protein